MGCFKPGRYPHLAKTDRKRESLTVYAMLEGRIPEKSLLDTSHYAHFLSDANAHATPC